MKEIEVVAAVIYERERGFLCALRGPKMSLAGLWEFPGGKVEPGEDHKQALKREIKEELGCVIDVGEPIVSITHDYEDVRVRLHTYWVTQFDRAPIAKEHEQLDWVSLDNLLKLDWAPADIPTVQKVLASKQHNSLS
ncbi:DNA mismatch repair protein MutT [Ammoniphilus oxalaticus]|uniref:8-oxo-dGTP diphosphatase n=1 Tax=Ammoniphilus oxalaticus TaxID=66863 RepID=A0A419SR59_9BACL|nr:(deoxy)nucleoside triphosphate pyrophosphohydrolase [Ammoniphilus oxalaticus]RKD27010.1 DNA mismatch repair protein MutT [Ammoniphilus oxalaticus]